MFGYQHTCTHDGDRCPDFDVDPFITATVEFENAQDESNAYEFKASRMIKGSRPTAWQSTFRRMHEAEIQRTSRAFAEEARLVYGSGPDLLLADVEDIIPLVGLAS